MIYLLEDDDSIRKLVIYTLESQGFQAEGFDRPGAFWRAMEQQQPELLLLDIMLPEEDGLQVLRRLRAGAMTRRLPVILLTAKNAEYDRVLGLDSGADDFISKPFGMMELVARIRAVLRRTGQDAAPQEYRVGLLCVCPAKHLVQVDGKEVILTYKEFELLCLLLENQGMVLTRNILMYKVWGAEQALLQMVRNGDLDSQKALNASVMLSNGVQVQTRDPLGQSKISVIVFCSLVCRAAIEGGLSPEEAYSLGDAYIQNAEGSRSMDDLNAIPMKMYDDFIHRVHNCRTNPKLSVAVQKCVDYIEMHLTERIRAADLAAMVGYSEYYITRKFREETGYSFSDYVIFAKIERAKVLLRSSDRSVQEIAAELGFATRSHFSRNFHKVTGKTPAQFRAGVQG